MKYIIVYGTDEFGNEGLAPVVFPKIITHADAARGVGRGDFPSIVVSAGFAEHLSDEHGFQAHGRSESLNVDSCSTDSKLLNDFLLSDARAESLFTKYKDSYPLIARRRA